jgi:polysaccharide biosynthesis protein PslJ
MTVAPTGTTGSAQRGLYLSSAVVLGSLALLAATVLTNTRPLEVAPVIALVILFTVAYRTLLAWDTLLALLVLIILFIPIQRYVLPGSLPVELEPYRLLVAFMIAGWIASLLVDPTVRLRRSGFEVPIVLILIGVLGSVLANSARVAERDPYVVKGITFLLSYILLFFFIVSVVKTTSQIERLLRFMVGGGVAVALFAIVESRTHSNVFDHLSRVFPLLDEAPFSVASSEEERGVRAFASSQHPIALGAALVLLIPPAVYLMRLSARAWLWWIAIVLLACGSLATLSRTSVLMLVAVVATFLWLRPRDTRRLWPLLLPAILVIHFAVPGTIGTLKASFLPEGGLLAEQQSNPGSRGQGRIADLGPSLREVAHQPLVGQGYSTRVANRPGPSDQILDDQWLGILMETGLIGLIGWLWLVGRAVRRLASAAKWDLSSRGWLMASLASSVVAFGVGMLTFDAFVFIQVTFLFFMLLALGAAALRTPVEPVT